MAEFDIGHASYNDHCRALGGVCIAWAMLDRKLTDVVSILIGQGPFVTACLFSGAENINPRCDAISKLLIVSPPSPDGEWRGQLGDLVKRIRTELAPRRNRFIHDEWAVFEDGVSRVQWGGHISKQPFEDPRVHFAKRHHGSTSEVDALTNEINEARLLLTHAVIAIVDGRLLGQPPEPFWL